VAFLILTVHYFLDPTFNPVSGILNEDESRHAIKSLRIVAGSEILIGDGKGNRYHCEVKLVGKKELVVNILSTQTFECPLPKLTIAIAPTKNPSRFEWFLEKATELGVYRIIPMVSKRTERPRFKHDRAERIIHAATKQSMRTYLPILEQLTPISELFTLSNALKLMAHCDEADKDRIDIKDFLISNPSDNVLILIGPEGDFTPEEVEKAKANGFQPVVLGDNRLRTETAGVFAAAVLF